LTTDEWKARGTQTEVEAGVGTCAKLYPLAELRGANAC
jgi:hypothetical protein